MIKSFKHHGIRNFFETGRKTGINPNHEKRLRLVLFKLDTAKKIQDLDFPGANLHPLKDTKKGFWAMKVSGNWRVIFQFKDKHVFHVDYIDYH